MPVTIDFSTVGTAKQTPFLWPATGNCGGEPYSVTSTGHGGNDLTGITWAANG